MRAASPAWTVGGQDEALQLGLEPVCPARAGEVAVLDERLDDLLDEERVAAGARLDQRREPVQRRVVPEQPG